jgi:geranylgeranyl diphosphate synthase, type I
MGNPLIPEMQSALSNEILSILHNCITEESGSLSAMLKYPIGLKPGVEGQGKRVRPIILLLACDTLGGNWIDALPAAAALELIHNFSLVHDDIQDNSTMRRGKDSAWKKYGTGQAINIGDLLFMLAQSACLGLRNHFPAPTVLNANQIINDATINMITGQYLDLAFEGTDLVDLDSYWKMVDGKTGALFSAAFGLGGLLAGKLPDAYIQLGLKLGRAFQVQDDWLGLWGETQSTGKSVTSDLMERKKSYPVVHALQLSPRFRDLWRNTEVVNENDARDMLDILDELGAREVTQFTYKNEYQQAIREFSGLFPGGLKSQLLLDFLTGLFNRAN